LLQTERGVGGGICSLTLGLEGRLETTQRSSKRGSRGENRGQRILGEKTGERDPHGGCGWRLDREVWLIKRSTAKGSSEKKEISLLGWGIRTTPKVETKRLVYSSKSGGWGKSEGASSGGKISPATPCRSSVLERGK